MVTNYISVIHGECSAAEPGDTRSLVVDLRDRTRLTEVIDQSANTPQPARAGGEFFAAPAPGRQTRYEALRAYLLDGELAAAVAARFGYTTAGLHSAVADFRAGVKTFFVDARPGPKTAPGKDAARTRIIALRAQGHSIDEIAAVLAAEGIGLNRTCARCRCCCHQDAPGEAGRHAAPKHTRLCSSGRGSVRYASSRRRPRRSAR